MLNREMTRQRIGAAIEVHRQLGPGLLKSAHDECSCHELTIRNQQLERRKPEPLVYRETKLDCGSRLDLLVEGKIVVELKSVAGLSPLHEASMLSYLKLSGHKLGLLINFNLQLLKDGIKRFVMPS
jgi:GxxExxY protein